MALKSSISVLLFCAVLKLMTGDDASGITIYWVQNGIQSTFMETCTTSNYDFVNLAFLPTIGNVQTPMINLAGLCELYNNG